MDILSYAMAKSSASANIDAVIASLPKGIVYKGAVAYESDLPNNPSLGDAYTVKYRGLSGEVVNGQEYVWGKYENVNQWIALGSDMSQYQDKLVSGTNIKTINGSSILGSGNIATPTYTPFKSSWRHDTIAHLLSDINSDTDAVVGRSYLGEVNTVTTVEGLFNGNAEILVNIMNGGNTSKVIWCIVSSSNVDPYHWEATFINGNISPKGWTPFVPGTRTIAGVDLKDNVTKAELQIALDDSTHRFVTDIEKSTWNGKQAALVSGTNIKTVNNTSLLGNGNIAINEAVGFTFDVSGDEPDYDITNMSMTASEIFAALNSDKFVYGISTGHISGQWILSYYSANSQARFTCTHGDYSYTLSILSDNSVSVSSSSLVGRDGQDGRDGTDGTPGVGVPTGGNEGDVLVKTSSTNYDTHWTGPVVTGVNQAGNQVTFSYSDGYTNEIDTGAIGLLNPFGPITDFLPLFTNLFQMADSSPGDWVGLSGVSAEVAYLYKLSVDIILNYVKVSGLQIATSMDGTDVIIALFTCTKGTVLVDGVAQRQKTFGSSIIGTVTYEAVTENYCLKLDINYNGEYTCYCCKMPTATPLPDQIDPLDQVVSTIISDIKNNISYADMQSYSINQTSFTIPNTSYDVYWTSANTFYYNDANWSSLAFHITFDDINQTYTIEFSGFE